MDQLLQPSLETSLHILVLVKLSQRKQFFNFPSTVILSWNEEKDLSNKACILEASAVCLCLAAWPLFSSTNRVIRANIIPTVISDSKPGEIHVYPDRFITLMHIGLCSFDKELNMHIPYKWLVMQKYGFISLKLSDLIIKVQNVTTVQSPHWMPYPV